MVDLGMPLCRTESSSPTPTVTSSQPTGEVEAVRYEQRSSRLIVLPQHQRNDGRGTVQEGVHVPRGPRSWIASPRESQGWCAARQTSPIGQRGTAHETMSSTAAVGLGVDAVAQRRSWIMKRVPLHRIALEANVSEATVSRVLNNQPNVAPKTRERVLSIVRILGRTPQSEKLIGLIVPETLSTFFSTFAFELDQECKRRDSHVLVANSNTRADKESELLDILCNSGVRGIVFTCVGPTAVETILSHPEVGARVPIIAFDRSVPLDHIDFVTCGSRKATRQAIEHLIQNGHSRIGYLRGLRASSTATDRYASFQYWMSNLGLAINPKWMFPGDFQVASGRRCAQQLLTMPEEERPTAIVTANDAMAVSLMQQLQKAGWSLPGQLSVIGFDGIPIGDWVHPRLTTMAQPMRKLARTAASILFDRISEVDHGVVDKQPVRRVSVDAVLTIRESVGPAMQPGNHHAHERGEDGNG